MSLAAKSPGTDSFSSGTNERESILDRQKTDKQPWYARGDPWELRQDTLDPDRSIYFETIFTQSNGYIGVRAYPEEPSSGVDSIREGYLAGVFSAMGPKQRELMHITYPWPTVEMVSLPEVFSCKVALNGETVDFTAGDLLDFSRSLSLRDGLLSRRVKWRSPAGRTSLLVFERFLSAANRHLGAQRISVTPVDWDGEVQLTFEFDGNTPTEFRAGDPAWISPPLDHLLIKDVQINKTTGVLSVETVGTAHRIGIATAIAASDSETSSPTPSTLRQSVTTNATRNQTITVERAFATVTSRDGYERPVDESAREIAEEAIGAGFDKTLSDTRNRWQELWSTSDIEIDGALRDQVLVRFALFSLLQMAPLHAGNLNVPARAYSFNRYNGLYFWDGEIFLLPFYACATPTAARNMLLFRYRTLEGARKTAQRLGTKGACYPWMTDSEDGREQSPEHIGDYLWHQTADIIYALDKYVRATGDFDFMLECGLEMLIESARFWISKFEHEEDGLYHLYDTVGPDEVHTRGKDNGYTNLMARHNLALTATWLDTAREQAPEACQEILERLDVDDSELREWHAAPALICIPDVPGLPGVPLQDEYLMTKEPLDDLESFTLQDFWDKRKREKYRVIKQADIILAMYMLQDEFSLGQIRSAYEFYEPLNLHISSLSCNTHSIIASRIANGEDAYHYFRRAAGLDLDNHKNATADGLHAAALGGTWETVVGGFAGMCLRADRISFDPQLPDEWNSLAFRVTYRGYSLSVFLSHELNRLTVSGNGLPNSLVEFRGTLYSIEAGLVVEAPMADGVT